MKKLIYSIVTVFVLLSAMFIGWLSFAQEESSTTLMKWSTFRTTLRDLAWWYENIEKIVRTGDISGIEDYIHIEASWEIPVYARYDWDDKTVYYYTEANTIYLNKDLTQMFSSFNKLSEIDMTQFDTSNVEIMDRMFTNCSSLTGLNLSKFVTNWVTNMKSMFNGCSKLETLDLSSFNTEEVTDMSNMFLGCSNLMTIYASDSFSTSKVTSSSQMFNWATSLVGWNWTQYNSSKVNKDYAKIDKPWQPWYFTEKSEPETDPIYESILVPWPEFNEKINKLKLENEWEWSEIKHYGIKAIKRADSHEHNPLEKEVEVSLPWVVEDKKVYLWFEDKGVEEREWTLYYYSDSDVIYTNEDSSYMFSWLSSLIELDLNLFNTSSTTNMEGMFKGVKSLSNLDLSNFKTEKVTNMVSMFEGCESLEELDLSRFDTSKVESMEKMFYNCKSLKNLDLSNFNTENVTNIASMFEGCESLEELDLSSFDTSSVQDVEQMFYQASKLKTVYASDLFDVEDVTSYDNMFFGATQLEWWYWTKVLQMWVYDNTYARIDKPGQLWYFTEDIPSDKTILLPWSVFNITLKNLWNNRSDIYNKDFVDSTIRKFEKASELTTEYTTWIISVPLSKYPVYAWYDDNDETIYYYTEADEIYLNPDSSRMFHQFTVLENINTSEFNTSEVENMRGMFNKAYNLETLDLSNFDTSNVTTMQSMFNECKTLKELDLRSFDTSEVENMQAMFNNANNLETIYVSNNFSTDNIIDTSAAMFLNNNKLVWGNWTKFSGEYSDSTYARIDKEWQQWYFTDATNITVKFIDENGDELYATWIAKWNVAAELTSDEIERETGHTLEYYADEGMTEEFDFNPPITKYTEIYTQWTVKQYHIAFVDRKWEVVSWADYNYGTPKADIVLPTAPEREWYGFSGWAWIPETMPAENVTWTAEYNIKQYHIAFVDRKWEVVSWADYDYGTPKAEMALPTAPSREWYTFAEWTWLPDKMPANDVTWTAMYNINKYHVSFVDREWEVVSWADYDYGTPKAEIVLPTAPSREWYTFAEWTWLPDKMPANDVTWTATYNINQYTLKFVKWNWEADEVSTKNYGEAISAPSDPTREWYTFKGWDKPVPATMPASDLIITAKWEAIAPSWWNGWWYSGWWGHSHDNSDHGSAWDEEKQNNTPEQETTPADNNQKNDTETQVENSTQNVAHEWLYKNWLTQYSNASDARLGDPLTRSEMAKLSSIFATNVLWETPDESKQEFCSQFADLSKLNGEMRNYVIKACELWYMWYQSNGVDALVKFRPYSPVTVAEASVIVSRMMWWNQNASSGKNWYKWHLYAAYNHWLLDDIRSPYRNITRWEAFEMFYRTSQAK